MSSFHFYLAELRRRRVWHVAGAYALVGAILVGAANDVLPRLALPEWTVTFVVVATLLGFPIAVVLAWAYELRPEVSAQRSASVAADVAPRASTYHTDADADLQRSLQVPTEQPSIVVLPFANSDVDSDNEYFTDGLTEELIAALAHVPELRVISRRSTMMLKGTKKSLSELARELGVSFVVEGAVRRYGNSLRMTIHLVNAVQDAELWSDTREGSPENVFASLEAASQAIVRVLPGTPRGRERQRAPARCGHVLVRLRAVR